MEATWFILFLFQMQGCTFRCTNFASSQEPAFPSGEKEGVIVGEGMGMDFIYKSNPDLAGSLMGLYSLLWGI